MEIHTFCFRYSTRRTIPLMSQTIDKRCSREECKARCLRKVGNRMELIRRNAEVLIFWSRIRSGKFNKHGKRRSKKSRNSLIKTEPVNKHHMPIY